MNYDNVYTLMFSLNIGCKRRSYHDNDDNDCCFIRYLRKHQYYKPSIINALETLAIMKKMINVLSFNILIRKV